MKRSFLLFALILLATTFTMAQPWVGNSVIHQMTQPAGYYFDHEVGYSFGNTSPSIEYSYQPNAEGRTDHYLQLNVNQTFEFRKALYVTVFPAVLSNFKGGWGYGAFAQVGVKTYLTQDDYAFVQWRYAHVWGDITQEYNCVQMGLVTSF